MKMLDDFVYQIIRDKDTYIEYRYTLYINDRPKYIPPAIWELMLRLVLKQAVEANKIVNK